MALTLLRHATQKPPDGPLSIDIGNPLTAGLLLVLPLTDAGSGSVYEQSGRVITSTGGLTWDSTGGRSGLQFNGTNQSLSVPLDLSGTSVVTVAFWAWWNAFANTDLLLCEFTPNYNTAPPDGFILDFNGSSGFIEANSRGTSANNPASFVRPSAAAWHHYMFVMDIAAAGGATCYIDGTVRANQVAGAAQAGKFSNSTLFFFSRNSASLWGAGKLEQFYLWNRALSASDAVQLMAEPYAIFQRRPLQRWFVISKPYIQQPDPIFVQRHL